ncbi:glycosyltransferase family 4 protein [Candidatus Woesearchaeota archaeon]|nr:glycosyltransferase family 4 protein [Candidatus Woesearchaeota archaeon]
MLWYVVAITMNHLRLLMVSEYFPPSVGGVETVVARMVHAFSIIGIAADVYSGSCKGDAVYDAVYPSKITRSPMLHIPRLNALSFILSGRLLNPINTSAYDIIHAHNPPSLLAVPKTRTILILTIHGKYAESFRFFSKIPFISVLSGWLERTAIRRADVVTCVSKRLADEMQQKYPQKRILHIPNFIDAGFFRPLPATKHVPTLIFVGTLHPVKNINSLIRAMRIMLRRVPDMRLLIIGEGTQRKSLERLAEMMGVKQNVRFLGTKSRTELLTFYNNADFLVLPSYTEGLPLTVLEAMSCGTPAIATRCSGADAFLPYPELLIESPTPPAIAHTILSCMMRAKRFDRRRIRKHVIKNFSQKAVIRSYLALYASMFKRDGSPVVSGIGLLPSSQIIRRPQRPKRKPI